MVSVHNVKEEPKDPRRVAAAKKAQETIKQKKQKKEGSVKSASSRGSVKKDKSEAGEKKKRAPTAFFIFSAEQRESIKKAHPGLKITEIASKLGEQWRGLTAEKKAVYEKKAAEAASKL